MIFSNYIYQSVSHFNWKGIGGKKKAGAFVNFCIWISLRTMNGRGEKKSNGSFHILLQLVLICVTEIANSWIWNILTFLKAWSVVFILNNFMFWASDICWIWYPDLLQRYSLRDCRLSIWVFWCIGKHIIVDGGEGI